jgi:hypothetical protein
MYLNQLFNEIGNREKRKKNSEYKQKINLVKRINYMILHYVIEKINKQELFCLLAYSYS